MAVMDLLYAYKLSDSRDYTKGFQSDIMRENLIGFSN